MRHASAATGSKAFGETLARLQRYVGQAGVVAVLAAHRTERVLVFAGVTGDRKQELAGALRRIAAAATPFPVELCLTRLAGENLRSELEGMVRA